MENQDIYDLCQLNLLRESANGKEKELIESKLKKKAIEIIENNKEE